MQRALAEYGFRWRWRRAAYHSLGLKTDGSIVAWGDNSNGQCNIPTPNTGFTAVAAGVHHDLGLKADGSIVAWGSNSYGQCNVPAPNTGFVAVAAGDFHSLGLKTDGSIVAWGRNIFGQCNVSAPGMSFTAVAGGGGHSLGITGIIPQFVHLVQFDAVRRGQHAAVHWAISQPIAHAGFHLWRQDPGHDRLRLNQALFSGQNAYDFIDPSPPQGPAEYWLQEMATDGSENWYGPAYLYAATIPSALRLAQNHPNPFNPSTSFSYDLPQPARAVLAVYDVRGACVATLVDADLPAGEQLADWDGRYGGGAPAPSGVYFARLETESGIRTVKLTLSR